MVIVVDTNVLSEPSAPAPDPRVLTWLRQPRAPGLFTTATVIAELADGVGKLPQGRRRIELQDALDLLIDVEYQAQILPFDLESARAYGFVRELRRIQGRPIQKHDAQIAAVCLVYGATLATRNTKDFEGFGLELIDPWQAE